MAGARIGRRLAVALLAAAVTLVVGAAPAWAAPALVASPDSGLADLQQITLTGSGFPAGASVAIIQCGPGGEVSPNDCDLSTLGSTSADSNGAFTATLTVRRIIETSVDGELDCAVAVGTCFAGADNFGGGSTASDPLGFDPNIPPAPALEVSGTVESAAVRRNVVLVTGTVECSQPAEIFLQVRVRQVVRRVFIDGTGGTDLTCDGEEPFSVVLRGETGILKPGPARVRLDVDGFNAGDNDSFRSNTSITLGRK